MLGLKFKGLLQLLHWHSPVCYKLAEPRAKAYKKFWEQYLQKIVKNSAQNMKKSFRDLAAKQISLCVSH
jgi:hypothetical protein